MPHNNDHLMSLKDIHITLGEGASKVHVLKGISLDVNQAETIAIVGPSGSGKSTLLMLMAGLENADSGSITMNETELTTLSEDQLAQFRGKHIGIIFQSFHLMPSMTALENVALPLELLGIKDAENIAKDMLDKVGLSHRLSHYPTQLSGGEQQRVAIARAIAPKPDLLIADEPTGNLDADTGNQIMDLLFNLNKDYNTTLILVTHDENLANKAGRKIAMRNGIIN